MKELTEKEKAKRYDEAFRIAQELYNNPYSSSIGKGYVCTVFPELKESESERIRNEIISYIKSSTAISPKTWIAWLEKQGNKSQGKSALEAAKEEKADNRNYIKPADRIKPKFHEGEWIVFNGLTLYVKEVVIVNGFYRTITKDGIPNSYDWGIDNAARLWTIKDAKPGDVLATLDEILIFEKVLPEDGGVSYCHYDFNILRFNFNKDDNWYFGKEVKVYPATKEQCNLLFQKMKEAGYKWDYNELKLEKFEPIIYMFKYYLKGNTNNMPTEFLVNWELSILENYLYILEKTLEEDDIFDYLKEVWQGYYGKEVYIDVYEKNVIKGSGPYYDLLFGFKVKGGKVWVRRKKE